MGQSKNEKYVTIVNSVFKNNMLCILTMIENDNWENKYLLHIQTVKVSFYNYILIS